jgi:rhamnulose-1-phosphate aldolase
MADASIESLRSHKVVLWEKHGVLSIGDDVGQAFDRIDILAKAAKIFLTCRNAGFMPEGLSSRQIEEIRNTILYK